MKPNTVREINRLLANNTPIAISNSNVSARLNRPARSRCVFATAPNQRRWKVVCAKSSRNMPVPITSCAALSSQ
jgi:hypothetical protein